MASVVASSRSGVGGKRGGQKHVPIPVLLLSIASLIIVASSTFSFVSPNRWTQTETVTAAKVKAMADAILHSQASFLAVSTAQDEPYKRSQGTYEPQRSSRALRLHGERPGRDQDSGAALIVAPQPDTGSKVDDRPSVGRVAALDGAGARNLVVGMAKSILEEQLAVFSASFREHVDKDAADIVVFIDNPVSDRMKAVARECAVDIVAFDESPLQPQNTRIYHPSTYRWPMIDEFLRKNAASYQHVLTADVRDTYFQADPFERMMEHSGDSGASALFVYEDDPTKVIGECGWNSGWIKSCYGHEMSDRLSSRRIFCSGIIMGTMQGVQAYTAAMTEKIRSDGFESCERNGVDQGIHNVLVHEGPASLKSILRTVDQTTGYVANMQGAPAQISQPEWCVLNPHGAEYAIVHQYDRNAQLTKHILGKYVKWDRSEKGKVCADYVITQTGDLLRGTCDLKPSGGIDADMCCKVCDREKGCRGFALVNSVCFLKSCNGPAQPPSGDSIVMGLRRVHTVSDSRRVR